MLEREGALAPPLAAALVVGARSIEAGPQRRVDAAQHGLGRVHQVFVRGVRLVELEHGELGVVAGAHPLVPEAAPDLVDPVQAPHQEPLQVQLRRDPEIEIHVEGVVVRLEGLGDGAAPHRVEERGLHLQEPLVVQEAADLLHHQRPGTKHVAHVGVGEEIHVALAVALLHVGEAVPLLGRRQERLAHVLVAIGADRQVTLHGADERAEDRDVVREIEELELRAIGSGERRLAVLAGLVAHQGLGVAERGADHQEGTALGHDPAIEREAVLGPDELRLEGDRLQELLVQARLTDLGEEGTARGVSLCLGPKGVGERLGAVLAQGLGALSSCRDQLVVVGHTDSGGERTGHAACAPAASPATRGPLTRTAPSATLPCPWA
jgi:hypothetical protein